MESISGVFKFRVTNFEMAVSRIRIRQMLHDGNGRNVLGEKVSFRQFLSLVEAKDSMVGARIGVFSNGFLPECADLSHA
jgi:hypothetical protein